MSRLLSLTTLLILATGVHAADEGWIDLLKGDMKATWQNVDPGWIRTDAVTIDPAKPNLLQAKAVTDGPIFVNGDKGRLKDLITKAKYGDCDVHIEFFLAKKSNSGIKFHAVYEIQIHDSFGLTKFTGEHNGGIYPRAVQNPKYTHIDDGIAPKVNASKKPGEWQTLDVSFKSARFDSEGKKTADAMIVKAVLNDQVIHENQAMKTPTGNNWQRKEVTTGPFMLQADHGPIAVRSLKIRPAKAE